MTVKEWLMRGRNLDGLIKQLEEQRNVAYRAACTITPVPAKVHKINGKWEAEDKVQTSKNNSTEDKMISHADYVLKIDSYTAELYKIKDEIVSAIMRMDDNIYRELLIAYYINFKTWEQIAVDIKKSWRWTITLHGRALEKFKKSWHKS